MSSVLPADVQQTLLIRVDVPEEWRPDVDQQDPEHLHIKEEEEELWPQLEGKQLVVKEETDGSMLSFIAAHVKTDDDEEKPLFSQHQMEDRDVPTSSSADQMKVEADGEDCGGAETSRNPDLNPHGDASSSSEIEVSNAKNTGIFLKMSATKKTIKTCPSCKTGYILSSDLHVVCEGCMGAAHARQALEPHFSCRACAFLTAEEKLRRYNLFPHAEVECQPRGDMSFKEILGELVANTSASTKTASGRNSASPVGDPEPASSPCLSGAERTNRRGPTLSPNERVEPTTAQGPAGFRGLDPVPPPHSVARSMYSQASSSEAVQPMLPPSSAPVKHTTLLHALPEIIERSAKVCGLEVPKAASQVVSPWLAGRFAAQHSGHSNPVWPCVPAVSTLLRSAASEPMKLRAPVSEYVPITKVQGFTDQVFPTVPPLEPSLSAVFGVKHVGKRITPPTTNDQLTVKLTDKIHQCSSQVGAATNNIALLALSISEETTNEGIGTAADAITNLCAALATCAAHISSWATLLQRQMWLKLSPEILEEVKKELLEGPVSPEGLFGPHFQSVFKRLQSSSEVLEQVQKYIAPLCPEPRSARRSVHWRDQNRSFRQQQRRSSPAATFAVPAPLASARGQSSQSSQKPGTFHGRGQQQQPSWPSQTHDARKRYFRK